MSTYYIRKTGSDSNDGLSPAAAFLTLNKFLTTLGTGAGPEHTGTAYMGAGTYRETGTSFDPYDVTIIGDVTGEFTGDAGPVVVTAYTTNDESAPSGSYIISQTYQQLTIRNIIFVGDTATAPVLLTPGGDVDNHLTIQDCVFLGPLDGTASCLSITFPLFENDTCTFVIERCLFRSAGSVISLAADGRSGSDFDLNTIFRNCVFETLTSSFTPIAFATPGAGAGHPGGIVFEDCTFRHMRNQLALYVPTGWSTSIPCQLRNSVVIGRLAAGTSGELVEDYNLIYHSAADSNVSSGAHSQRGVYAPLFSMGHEPNVYGGALRPAWSPMAGSPALGFGSDGTYDTSVDLLNGPRPAGGASALKAVGAYERGDSAVKDVSVYHTAAPSIKLVGPGYQDFQLPVAASAITASVWVRFDSTYAGTLPQMKVLNGGEAGVADDTATATGSADTWSQISLNFTPTSVGIVTIRLQSNDTNGGGAMYADDFAVA